MTTGPGTIYRFETFVLDITERRLLNDGKAVPITPKAFDVLAYFVARAGHLVEKEALLQDLWPGHYVEEANVSRIVHTLRRTLGDSAGGKRLIETVPKKGYRFLGNVAVSSCEKEAAVVISKSPGRRKAWYIVGSSALIVLALAAASGFYIRAARTKTLSFEGMVPSRVTSSGDVLSPTVSPDGKSLLYIKKSGEGFSLQLADLGTGISREIRPVQDSVRFWAARFTADGSSIYYVETKDNDLGTLYRVPNTGGEPETIASHVSGGIARSPDGKQIGFVRIDKQAGTNSIIIANADGTSERKFVETDTDRAFMSLDWSPDGTSLAYVLRHVDGEKARFSVVDKTIDGGSERRIGESWDAAIMSAVWLPQKEGFFLNAVDETSKLPQIYFRSFPEGTDRRITNDLTYYYDLSMTADGKSIFSQKIEQDRYIWQLPDVDSAAATQLTFEKAQHFDAVDWLDSDTLTFDPDLNGSHQARNLWTLNIGSAKAAVLIPGSGNDENNSIPRVASHLGSVTYISSKSGIQQLWTAGVDGSYPLKITDLQQTIYEHRRSADGKWIYLQYSTGGEGRLARMPFPSGEMTEVGGKEVHLWALSPDGNKLAYSTPDDSTGKFVIKIRSIDDPATLKVFYLEPSNTIVWSKSGKFIYFVTDKDSRKNIWRQPVEGGEAVQLTGFKDAEILDLAESPDGRSLAIIRSNTAFDAVRFDFPR